MWIVDYRASFFEGAETAWIDAEVAALGDDGTINLVLHSNAGGTTIARLTGDAPGGPFAPTAQPTPCGAAGEASVDGGAEAGAEGDAGGVSAVAGARVVADGVSFVGCSSTVDGGSVHAVDAVVRLSGCAVEGSASAAGGGAVATTGGSLDVVRTTFSDVVARAGYPNCMSPSRSFLGAGVLLNIRVKFASELTSGCRTGRRRDGRRRD